MPTLESKQNFTDALSTLREQLTKGLAPLLIQNPQIGDVITATFDQKLADFEALSAGAPRPADGGLAALIGLGPGASADLGQAELGAPVQVYDETVTSERINAVADLYYVYQHERLGVFRAMHKLKELFTAGTVRLSTGQGAFKLYQWDRKEVLRYSHSDRFAAYRRILGYGNGPLPAGARQNGEFHPLFSHFINQVSVFWRDKRISETIRTNANDPSYGSIAIVRRAGLDLRNNLKWSSYGNLNVMRVELMELLNEAFLILGADDVRSLFGADTVWDVIEEILVRYYGERPATSPRQRMAVNGGNVLRWLGQAYILKSSRAEFEALLGDIAEDAEEWMTSAQALGLAQRNGRGRVTPAAESGRRTPTACPAIPRV